MSNSFYKLFVPTAFFFACCFFTALIQAQPVDSLNKPNLTEILRASTNLAIVKKHIQAREYDSAEQLAKESRRVLSKAFGNHSPHVAVWLEELGKIYFTQNRYHLALVTLDSALNIYNRVRRVDHPQNRSIYNNMGVINLVVGNYDKADSLLRKAISIFPDTSFIISPYKVLAQSFLARSQLDSALHYYLQTLSYCDTSKQRTFVGQIYVDLGMVYTELADYETAGKYLLLASKIFSQPEQANFIGSRSDLASNMSWLHVLKGEYNLALQYAQEAMALVVQDVNQLPHSLGIKYSLLGEVWQYKGDNQLAGEFFELALLHLEKSLHSKHRDVVLSLSNIANYLANSGQTERAIKQYHKGLDIALSIFGPEHQVTNGLYFRLAQTYLDYQDTLIARQYYLEAFNSGQKLYPVHNYKMCQLRRGLGYYFSKTGAYATAIPYFLNNVGIFAQIPKPELAMDYCGLAWCYGQLQQYYRADSCIQKALLFFNYHPNNFDTTNSLNGLADGLKIAAALYQDWYQQSAQLSHLRQARFYALQTIAAIDELATGFSTESKVLIAKRAHERYTLATQINLELYAKTDSLHYRQQAFDFAERSKSILLLNAMQEQEALKVPGIPTDLLLEEHNLRIDLAFQGKKRQEKIAAGHTETDTLVLAYSAKIKNLKDQATSLKAKLEKEYPQYYATKYGLKTIDVRSLQSKILSPNQTLLEYLVGDSSIFIFVIQKQKYGTVEVKKDFPLEQWVRDMTTNGMAKVKRLNPNATRNYTEAAFRLYEKLIAPVLKANYLLGQELIIIPDGILGQVPFEALLASKPSTEGNYANYHYLLKQHQLSYCYSATLLAQMIEKKHQKVPTATLLAMAPFASSTTSSLKSSQDTTKLRSAFSHLRDTLSALQYSGDEIRTIAQRWAGQFFYYREATLNEFVKSADKYRIIHLATHGKADARAGDYSFLAFHTGTVDSLYDKLYARDLYNMSLNADMVVLSACETGIGQLQRGEGIVSLARAFTFAGTKSIVTTLWSVNDVKTKELMALFYAELEKPGMRKDAALRNAKLRYLQQFNTEADPFFWAGFIAIGDMSSLR